MNSDVIFFRLFIIFILRHIKQRNKNYLFIFLFLIGFLSLLVFKFKKLLLFIFVFCNRAEFYNFTNNKQEM